LTTPRPQVLERKVAELGRKAAELYAAAKKLQDPYTLAYGIAYEATSGGGAGGSTEISQSDPTGDAAVDGVIEELEDHVQILEGAQTSLVGKRGVARQAGPWDFAEVNQAAKSSGGATF
jgi:hypothetical protein